MSATLPRREERVSDATNPWARPKPIVTLAAMNPGARIEVRSRFDQRWARGFELAEIVEDEGQARYRVRRRSDGSVLPALFIDDDVREEKRRSSMWWV
jgi:hypothetical protein